MREEVLPNVIAAVERDVILRAVKGRVELLLHYFPKGRHSKPPQQQVTPDEGSRLTPVPVDNGQGDEGTIQGSDDADAFVPQRQQAQRKRRQRKLLQRVLRQSTAGPRESSSEKRNSFPRMHEGAQPRPPLVNGGSHEALSPERPKVRVNVKLQQGSASPPRVEKAPRRPPASATDVPVERRRKEVSDTESVSTLDSVGSRTSGSDKENRKEDWEATKEKERSANNVPAIRKKALMTQNTAVRPKTLKRTRKFVIDGVVMTTTTSKVIYGDLDEDKQAKDYHFLRKQELRELKMLQKMENKQFQDLDMKEEFAREQQQKKFDQELTTLLRDYDNDLEALNRTQKQQVEKAEQQQDLDLKGSV
ncbi:hypothetical protein HPB50_018197 [Hyalomma asiaticum]|uniref:Uncharacterized protein n=1 Tax=Hyalomma asiaticum TaxID=266040 RepID=A0ACB7TR11_HYAAI|nr:hypothetical protein HPB50_018197 [Hyalomma asiaticum]